MSRKNNSNPVSVGLAAAQLICPRRQRGPGAISSVLAGVPHGLMLEVLRGTHNAAPA